MKVLLDTHALLWLSLGDEKLSNTAREVIGDPVNLGSISPASYWEVAIKVKLGKYKLHRPFDEFFENSIKCNGLEILPITIQHATVLSGLPQHHRDPFDRMLIAQAIAEDCPIISTDTAFDAYSIERIW